MIKAKEAKKLSILNKNVTQRISKILKEIKETTGYGEMFIEYDDSRDGYGYLTSKEISFLRKLGYSVSKGKREEWEGNHGRYHSSYRKAKISWNK